MKNIVLFDTASGSQNMGDYIINESVNREMGYLLDNNFVVRYATHTPVTHFYQNCRKNEIYNYCKTADYKFLAGTNAVQFGMIRPWANLNINRFNCSPYEGVITIGVGCNPNKTNIDYYTKSLYKRILNKNYTHSVRDEETKKILESMGLKAINTGCATMWMFTRDFCNTIKKSKSESVIFTLTDYKKDIENDQRLIDILKKNYTRVYYWVQGSMDYTYFSEMKNTDGITVVNPNLKAYEAILTDNNIDYVGTRLHAGIYAMQHKVRSIIISIDNRTRDMKETYNLVTIEREDISKLEEMINSEFATDVHINEQAIKGWKEQF